MPRAVAAPGVSLSRPGHGSGCVSASPHGCGLTEVELTWIEGRHEQWIRFGRVAAERILSRSTRVMAFRPGAVFGFVRWTSNDFGTIHSTIAIAIAMTPGEPFSTLPFVRPGAEILARIADVAAIGGALGAGTNCGSCRPALARILTEETSNAA